MLQRTPQQQLRLQSRSDMIVFGLGNPGPEYEDTRHNVGFMAIERLAARKGMKMRKRCLRRYKWARCGSLVLVEPLTYMNKSGEVFSGLVGDDGQVVVIVDNMDLPVGRLRIRVGGSSAGHNGLKSIIGAIGSGFIRVYIGIGRPDEGTNVVDHVLGRFPDEDRRRLEFVFDEAASAISSIADGEDLKLVIQRTNSFQAPDPC